MKNHRTKNFWHLIVIGIIIGVVALALLRLAFMPSELATHYHSNFAVFINGERLDLSADKYMEDVEGCKPDYVAMQPEERVHMHNNEDVVAHVHDEGVTWGHFFSNIGFSLSDNALATDEGVEYRNRGNRTLKFIVNGEQVDSISNSLLGSEDQVLISYGTESLEKIIAEQVPQLADNAAWHNEHPDPGSCSGEIDAGFWAKVRRAVWY